MIGTAMAIAQVGMSAVKLMNEKNDQRDLRIKSANLKKEAYAYLDSLTNEFAAFQASDTKERLAMDQQAQNVANAMEVASSTAEGAAQLSNLVRAQDRTNLELMAGLDEKEMNAQQVRMQGAENLRDTQAKYRMDFNKQELIGTNEALAASKANQGQLEAQLIGGIGDLGGAIVDDFVDPFAGTAGAKLGDAKAKEAKITDKMDKTNERYNKKGADWSDKKVKRVGNRQARRNTRLSQNARNIETLQDIIKNHGLGYMVGKDELE